MGLTVLMNAGPWLPVPPGGYGGIENVVAALVPQLRRLGVRVVLATVGSSTLPADGRVTRFDEGQFGVLQRPYNQVSGIAHAHLQAVVAAARRPGVDLVHDHVEVVGLSTLAAMGDGAPPVLHTLHWDLAKHADFYGHLDLAARVRVNGVSAAQLAGAPPALRRHSLGHVHLATPLAVGCDRLPQPAKERYAVVLGRITPGKGQALAARLAHAAGFDVVLAGPVGPYRDPAALAAALASQAGDAAAANPDVRYWREEVAPHVDGTRVRWVGTVAGAERDGLVAGAVASLFPLQWEEPGGTAVVESLALGTPPVGFARGCLPELVDHGRTGLVAAAGEEGVGQLADLLHAAAHIDPRDCRREAATRFTPSVMARRYVELYEELLAGAECDDLIARDSRVALTGEPETV